MTGRGSAIEPAGAGELRLGIEPGIGAPDPGSVFGTEVPTTSRAAKVVGTTVVRTILMGIGAVTAAASARLLGPGGRGQYAVLATLATTSVAVGHLSLEQSHAYLWSEGHDRDSLVSNGIVLGVTTGLFVAGATLGLVHLLGPHRLPVASPVLLAVAMATIPFQMVVLYLNGLLILADRIGRTNAAAALGAALLFTGTIALAVVHRYTLHSLVYLWAASTTAPVIVVVRSYRIRLRSLSLRLARATLAVGARYHVATAALFMLWRVDVLLLDARVSAAQVGLYSVAVAVAEMLYLLSDTVAHVVLPQQVVGSIAESGAFTARAVRVNVVVAAVALAGVLALSPVLLPLAFGAAFRHSQGALVALGPGVVALAAVRPISGFIIRLNRPLLLAAATITALAMNVGLNLALIPHLGIIGASIASTVAYSYLAVVYVVWMCRASGLTAGSVMPRIADIREPAKSLLLSARGRRGRGLFRTGDTGP